MGVSVSYNGSGGRRSFNLDGVPTGDAAKTLGLPQKKHYVPDTLKKMLEMPAPKDPIEEARKGKVKLNDLDANPGTLSDKMLPGGGVVASPQGVCLRGEEQSPLVNGVQLYGSVNGSKKYHTIDEIDPKGQPHHVGAKHGDDTPEPNNEPVVANQPQSYQVASRIVAERDDIAGLLKLYELDKDVSTSSFGRTVGVTAERRRMICAIPYTNPTEGRALPYEVRWDGSLDNGEGRWKVYLPTEHLLYYGDTYISTSNIGGVSPIQDADANDTGWYSFDDIDTSADHVWLVVTKDGSGTSAEFSATQGTASTGKEVFNICVAELSCEEAATEGDPPKVDIKQSLVGAFIFGSSSGKTVPGNFEPIFAPDAQDDYKVKLDRVGFGFCPFGRGFYSGPRVDSSAKIESGIIYLEVQHPGPSGSDPDIYVKGALSMDQVSFTNRSDTTKTLIPLYSIADGAITVDYRSCMSLPMREL